MLTKGDILYAIGLARSANGEAVIHSLASTVGSQQVASVALLGSDAKLIFEQRADGLRVQLPTQAAKTFAYVLSVRFAR